MPRRTRQDPSKNLVGFVVGAVRYAVPIARVREIVNPLSVVALPGSAPEVLGVADYREEVVAVIDLRRRFGLPDAPDTRRTKWIVLAATERLVALVVDAVTDVFRGDEDALRAPPAVGRAAQDVAGVATRDGELVFVVDPDRLASVGAAEARAEGAP